MTKSFLSLLTLTLVLISLTLFGEHSTSPERRKGGLPEDDVEATNDRIEREGSPDTKPIRLLLRIPKSVVDRFVQLEIDEKLNSSSVDDQIEGTALEKKWQISSMGPLRTKRYHRIARELLDKIMEKGKARPEKTMANLGGLFNVSTLTEKITPSLGVPEEDQSTVMGGSPGGLGQAYSLAVLNVKTSTAFGVKESKQPVRLVFQIIDGNPPPMKADKYFHANLSVSTQEKPTVSVASNPKLVSQLPFASRTFLQNGLLEEMRIQLLDELQKLPKEGMK